MLIIGDRFTKALDHIKSLRKDRVAALKVDGERLNFLKQDRDKADSVSDPCKLPLHEH
jgi:hypothetical protein